MSCDKCTNIVFKPWDNLDPGDLERINLKRRRTIDSEWRGGDIHLVYIHHRNMTDLKISSGSCHFCRKLYVAFQQALMPKPAVPEWKDAIELEPRPTIILSCDMSHENLPSQDAFDRMGGNKGNMWTDHDRRVCSLA